MDKIEIIYNQHCQKIYNLALRMTGDRDNASDITQETFIQALKSIGSFRGESQIYTWLYRIAMNKCIRFLNKKSRTTFLSLQEIIEEVSSPVDQEIPEKQKLQYISQVKEGCLSGLLRCLSYHQRLAFILNVLLDLTIEQVADITGKSSNATRILIHRSKQNLKEFLCNNCSLYDSNNPCRCENLINFSLKQGWIGSDSNTNDIMEIETEIKNLKDVVSLYKTIDEKKPSDDFNKQFKQLLDEKKKSKIFRSKKVK